MKRVLSLVVVIALCFAGSTVFCGQENNPPQAVKENPMASFMGVKWGTNALEFDQTFNKSHSIKNIEDGFGILNYKLGDLTLENIIFMFSSIDGVSRFFVDSNYEKFVFDRVYINFNPDLFDDLFAIFKTKYGEPTKYKESNLQNAMGAIFLQKHVLWADYNIKRKIIMAKYGKTIKSGIIALVTIDPDSEQKKEEKTKAAAEQL